MEDSCELYKRIRSVLLKHGSTSNDRFVHFRKPILLVVDTSEEKMMKSPLMSKTMPHLAQSHRDNTLQSLVTPKISERKETVEPSSTYLRDICGDEGIRELVRHCDLRDEKGEAFRPVIEIASDAFIRLDFGEARTATEFLANYAKSTPIIACPNCTTVEGVDKPSRKSADKLTDDELRDRVRNFEVHRYGVGTRVIGHQKEGGPRIRPLGGGGWVRTFLTNDTNHSRENCIVCGGAQVVASWPKPVHDLPPMYRYSKSTVLSSQLRYDRIGAVHRAVFGSTLMSCLICQKKPIRSENNALDDDIESMTPPSRSSIERANGKIIGADAMYKYIWHKRWELCNGEEGMILLDHILNVLRYMGAPRRLILQARRAADKIRWPPLHVAAMYGAVGVISKLLIHGAAVDARGPLGFTPLQLATLQSRQGSNLPSAFDFEAAVKAAGKDPLSHKHTYGRTRILEGMKMLLDAGANPNETTHAKFAPVHLKPTEKALRLLIDHGADVTSCVEGGSTALHLAVRTSNARVARFVRCAFISLLSLSHRVDDSCSRYKTTARSVDIQLCDENLSLVFKKNDMGWTPLHEAVDIGHAECICLLLHNGALPENAKDGWDPSKRCFTVIGNCGRTVKKKKVKTKDETRGVGASFAEAIKNFGDRDSMNRNVDGTLVGRRTGFGASLIPVAVKENEKKKDVAPVLADKWEMTMLRVYPKAFLITTLWFFKMLNPEVKELLKCLGSASRRFSAIVCAYLGNAFFVKLIKDVSRVKVPVHESRLKRRRIIKVRRKKKC